MSNLAMADSIEVSAFAGLRFDALLGYVHPSSWPDFALECTDYPVLAAKHRVLSISPSALDDADGVDCENGDVTPGREANFEVPDFLQRQLDRGVWRPFAYASEYTWENLGLRTATDHFGDSIRRMVAKWVDGFQLLPGYDMQQCFGPTYQGRNVDMSWCLESAFPVSAQPVPKNDLHYPWYDKTKRHTPWGEDTEYDTTQRYDDVRKTIAHPKEGVHPVLAELEHKCNWFAGRCWSVGWNIHPLINGHPKWATDHLGWRRIYLARRAQSMRMV